MHVTFSGGTQRQRSWFQEAMDRCIYPWDFPTVNVTVSWGEPPCPGHSDFACTTESGGSATIVIRDTLDTQNSMDAPVKQFYQETCIHELGHVVMFTLVASPDTVAGYFYHDEVGEARRYGTAADLNPLDQPWDMRVQEAMAETFKDVFFPESLRAYDNRTQWQLDQQHYKDFTGLILPPADPGSPGSTGNHLNLALTLLSVDSTGEHIPPDVATANGEFLDRPYPDGEEWTTTYHMQFDNYSLPENAENVTAVLHLQGSAFHFPTRIEGSPTIPATYTFDTALDMDFADTEIATGVYDIGGLNLHDPSMTLTEEGLVDGEEQITWQLNKSVPPPAPAALVDMTFWAAKAGVDSPWPWTGYNFTWNSVGSSADPKVVLTYDVPEVPPTPAPDAPPWPYQDPELGGGGGPVGVVRIGQP